jgi:transcriptional regulator with XRE-family HTH domain
MTPNEIKSLMILKGIKQSSIAAQLGVLRSTVSGAVNGQRPSKRIQKAIAKALNESYKKLWGKAA